MNEPKMEWMVKGDCTEACTSPPVCPYYWGSSTPTDLHEGKNQCEGVFSFHIREGYYGETDLSGLNAGLVFNTPIGGTVAREPWPSVLYIDDKADEKQAVALEDIFTRCWSNMGTILAVKRAPITFLKEAVGDPAGPGYRHTVRYGDVYSLKAETLMTMNGKPRYISGMMGGLIYVGKSTENRVNEPELPRGKWDRPEMSNTYYEFELNPNRLNWVP